MSRLDYQQARHYTLYWKIADFERHDLNRYKEATYAGSLQLKRVHAGDTLWLINVYHGRLFLLGRLRVAGVTPDRQQAQELVNTNKDWHEGDYYAIADKRDVEPLRENDITELVEQLVYVDMDTPLRPYPVDAMQFRALRELTSESATLINQVWRDTSQSTLDGYLDEEDTRTYTEGRLVKRTFQQRERNRQLVEDAKVRAQRLQGAWVCEACGFNFEAVYGTPYIEAHHAYQMASLTAETQTTVNDLHMLCANCHRMVHTETPPMTIETLRRRIEERRKKT